MKYAKIFTDPIADTGRRREFEGSPPDLSHKTPPQKWIPVIVEENPRYDTDTERLSGKPEAVTLTEVTQAKKVVPIPQQEQDDRAEVDQIKAVALDLKNGKGSADQRLNRVERVLFRMLKDQYGN